MERGCESSDRMLKMPNQKPRHGPERPSRLAVDFALDLIPPVGLPAPARCAVPACPGGPDWTFADGSLCQDHFEEYSSDAFWADQLGEPQPEIPDWLEGR
jgi:hypothetical protein